MRRAVLIGALAALTANAGRAEELRNWFDDPFFRLTAGFEGCREPTGPRGDAAQRQAQSHRRAEKGTTCWLAREADCERPNAYAYDRDIARDIRERLGAAAALQDSSLWVTVQGRIVYVEGCVRRAAQGRQIEDMLRALPHVQQAIAIVTTDPRAAPPYRPFDDRQAPPEGSRDRP